MLKKRTVFLVLLLLIPLSFTLIQCFNNQPVEDSRGPAYAGSASCVKCHSKIYENYTHTAHFLSTQPASLANIQGSFNKDSNTYQYTNILKVRMENRHDTLLQVAYESSNIFNMAPFDIVVGVAKAQTYLYWRDNQLFQLPISYFKGIHSWANSPGYADNSIVYDRPILRQCLECHSSNINPLPPDAGEPGYSKASIIYGIDCERCHGPAAKHVSFQTENPDVKTAKFITTYQSLSRSQKLDACALCHSGKHGDAQINTFMFKMGDTLSKFRPVNTDQRIVVDSLDVHVNQNALLAASKCFIMSNMDCNTCHDTHTNQRGNTAMFTQKCLDCHSEAKHNFCTLAPQLGTAIKTYCISCHMPQKDSHVIKMRASEGKKGVPYLVRTHRIAIYPEETQKIMSFIKEQTPAR